MLILLWVSVLLERCWELNPRPHTCWSNNINIELTTPQLPTCLFTVEFNTGNPIPVSQDLSKMTSLE